jgi:ATP-dependent DNA helicase RecG
MTPEQIAAWAGSGESETLEFKKTTGERREGARTICAMLNHRGGRVVFGIHDGHAVGQHLSDRSVEEVVQELREIDPPAFPTLERVKVDGGRELLVVSTPTGQNRPYTHRGHAFRRLGNTNTRMSADEYQRVLLERLHGERRWENESTADVDVGDLDHAEILRTVEDAVRRGRMEDPITRNPSEILRGLGLMRDGRPLRAAVVLFGRPSLVEIDFPQCLLRVAKFRGTDRDEFIDSRQFHGNAFTLLARANRFLQENLPVAGRIAPGLFERVDDPLYPPVALREALANAFCHRDYAIGGGSVALAIYDDRLEVTSSGPLHFGLTPEALFAPHESLPWNPLIARVFFRRGIIESWGRGTTKIAELARKAGLPRPDIEDSGGSVTVRFRPNRYVPPQRVAHDLTERQRHILAVLQASPKGLALRDIRARLDEDAATWETKGDLALLKQLELIESKGRGRGAYWALVRR